MRTCLISGRQRRHTRHHRICSFAAATVARGTHVRLATLATLSALLAMTGCAQSPPVKTEEMAPLTWVQPDGDTAPDWTGLLDPTLAELQRRALAANRDITLAAQRWRQADLVAQQAALRWSPSAGLASNASRPLQTQSSTRNVDIGGVTVPVTTSTGWSRSYGASLSTSYEIDLWNRLGQALSAQQAQAEAARTDIAAARVLIRSRVAECYWTLGALQAQRPLAQAQVELAKETLSLIRLRVREGKLLPLETDKAAAALQAAQVKLADLEADALLQRHALALLLDESLPGPDPQARLPDTSPPRWNLPEPGTVLMQRPDVQRARLAVDAALARLRASEADRYPRLSFSASISTGGTRSSDWLAQPLGSLAANLVVPMIDWRRLDLQRDVSRSELDSAALTLRDTLHKALAEIEQQRIDAERLSRQLDANAVQLAEAAETERLAALRYEVGTIARADWLQTRQALLDAKQGRLQLQLRQWQIQASLFKALGGA